RWRQREQRVVLRLGLGKEGPTPVTKPIHASLLPLGLRTLVLRVHRDGQPLVGGLVEDPRLRPELTAPDRGTERARRRVVTALSGLWLYEEHRVSSGWSPDAPDLMPALLPAAGCVMKR